MPNNVIAKDLSYLPKAEPSDTQTYVEAGREPDREPQLAPVLAQAWYDQWAERFDRHLPTAIPDAGPFRASWAASCARQLAYNLAGTERTEPMTLADIWRTSLGSVVHERFQEQYAKVFPEAKVELDVDLRPLGLAGSAHTDLVVPDPYEGEHAEAMKRERWMPVEIKTINGTGFKMSATDFKGVPEGPRESALVQLALQTIALVEAGWKIERAKVVYLSLELVGPELAEKIGFGGEVGRFAAEWTYTVDELRPIAEAERDRMMGILGKLEADRRNRAVDYVTPGEMTDAEVDAAALELGYDPTVIVRSIPQYEVGKPVTYLRVVDPSKGTTAKGSALRKVWQCRYCGFQSQCVADMEAGR